MAGTVVITGDYLFNMDQGRTRCVTATCTHHTDNSLSDTVSETETGLKHGSLAGWLLDEAWTAPGTTAPTDATDLTISGTIGSVAVDLLGGAGTDQIDATSHLKFVPLSGGVNKQVPIPTGNLTVATANNAVASAIFYLVLWLR